MFLIKRLHFSVENLDTGQKQSIAILVASNGGNSVAFIGGNPVVSVGAIIYGPMLLKSICY